MENKKHNLCAVFFSFLNVYWIEFMVENLDGLDKKWDAREVLIRSSFYFESKIDDNSTILLDFLVRYFPIRWPIKWNNRRKKLVFMKKFYIIKSGSYNSNNTVIMTVYVNRYMNDE